MFETIVSETVKLREAPSHALSIFDYDAEGTGARTYQELIEEVVGCLSTRTRVRYSGITPYHRVFSVKRNPYPYRTRRAREREDKNLES